MARERVAHLDSGWFVVSENEEQVRSCLRKFRSFFLVYRFMVSVSSLFLGLESINSWIKKVYTPVVESSSVCDMLVSLDISTLKVITYLVTADISFFYRSSLEPDLSQAGYKLPSLRIERRMVPCMDRGQVLQVCRVLSKQVGFDVLDRCSRLIVDLCIE